MVKSGCPATDVGPPGSGAAFKTHCAAWRVEALRRIIALRPAVVLLGNATNYLGKDTPPSRLGVSPDEWRAGTRRTLEALAGAGLRVAAIRDNPIFELDIPTCLARSTSHSWFASGSCEMDRSKSLDPAVFEAEKAGARDLPNIHFIDLTDQLCQRDGCWVVKRGVVMYRDNNHLTATFADSLMPLLESQLLPILTTPG